MGFFRVLLCGRHLRLDVDGQQQELGFYTTRFVDASSPEQAATLAIQLLKEHPTIADQLRRTPGVAVLVESVEALAAGERPPPKQLGLAFFSEDGEPPLA